MVTVNHEGIEIKYDEVRNRWEVDDEEHGLTLSRQSLDEARKGITQTLKKQKTGRFKRFKAWSSGRWGYNSKTYLLVTVTSIVEAYSKLSSQEAWITYPKKSGERKPTREKIMLNYLYKDTERNRQRISKINELRSQVNKLETAARKVEEKLDTLETKGEKRENENT